MSCYRHPKDDKTLKDKEQINNPNLAFEEHTFWQSIGLHLFPGFLGGAVYFSIVNYVRSLGYPSIAALILVGALVITPFELGVLIYQSRKTNSTLFGSLIKYIQPLSTWQYFFWVFILVLSTGVIMAVLVPVAQFIESLFSWLPSDMLLDMGLSKAYSTSKLILTYVFLLLFIVIIAPTVEEFYFRGYLLPRMPTKLKKWTPIIHSLLFAIYHTWTPWMIVSRTLGVLPLIYVVKKKQNIYLGVISHCLMNSIDFIVGLVFIFNQF